MPEKLLIAYDVDDCIVPMAEKAVEYYNSVYEPRIGLENFYGDAESWGVSDIKIASSRINEYLAGECQADLINPYPEAKRAIRALSKVHRGIIVTGRMEFMRPVTDSMVDTHFSGVFEDVILTSHFSDNPVSKGQVCRESGVDVIIDDALVHCYACIEESPDTVALLMDKPWNRVESLPSGIIRCLNWLDVRREVGKIARQ